MGEYVLHFGRVHMGMMRDDWWVKEGYGKWG